MKGFAMLGIGKSVGLKRRNQLLALMMPSLSQLQWPLVLGYHTVFEGALGEREDMLLGHEAVGEVASRQ